jgi:hypothetical protein
MLKTLPPPRFKGFGSTFPVQFLGILRKRLKNQGKRMAPQVGRFSLNTPIFSVLKVKQLACR